MTNMQLADLKNRFTRLFGGGDADIAIYQAPGRVNLIGEHIDYNGGYVFPAALTLGTTLLLRARNDGQLRMASTNFPLIVQKAITNLVYDPKDDWVNYPKGVAVLLEQNGVELGGGYDMLFHGDIPNGAGLSSSASIEVVTAYALLDQAGARWSRTDIALLAQRAENEYIGVMCGIMDQFAVAQGKQEHAVLLRCSDLDFRHVPFKSEGYQLVIGNTNKRRELAHSAYNQRRSECDQALAAIRGAAPEFAGLESLCALTEGQFASVADRIEDETVRRRAKHAVEENARVLRSVELLSQGDLAGFGKLMTESHESLRDLYEVTCKELDMMVAAALSVPGVLGARMTGAGFGGCTVSLVRSDAVQSFIETVGAEYAKATELQADFYVCGIGDGVSRLTER